MKQKAKKIVIVLLALLLVTGAIILCSNKLVFGLNYEKNNVSLRNETRGNQDVSVGEGVSEAFRGV